MKTLALSRGIPVYQPASLRNAAAQEELQQLAPDVMIVVAYGLILPQEVLSSPRNGCLNVHASLLPRWRGAAPIQRAIEAGDTESGVTIMQMDEGLDTGDMLLKVRSDIAGDETTASLHDKLQQLGGPALTTVLNQLISGTITPEKQDATHTCYASKISKSEAKLDWQQSALSLERKIRAFNPFPVAYFELSDENVRVWQASVINEFHRSTPGTIIHSHRDGIDVATGQGVLRLLQLQLPGKKIFSAAEILNGHGKHFAPGQLLG